MRYLRRYLCAFAWLWSLWGTCAGYPQSALAVVIAAGDGTGHRLPPSDDPGWTNVGKIGTGTSVGSGVYLGDGWMLTAAHVGEGVVTFTDQRAFTPITGSLRRLNNPTEFRTSTGDPLSITTDLAMFRINGDPGLPGIRLAETSPIEGSQVMMIGYGGERESQLINWGVFTNNNNQPQWFETDPLSARFIGYETTTDRVRHWGVNRVTDFRFDDNVLSVITLSDNLGDIVGYRTLFNYNTLPGYAEAQATQGDSGGAVFQKIRGVWELVGVMVSVGTEDGQPEETAVYNTTTQIGDISVYRDQIEVLLNSTTTSSSLVPLAHFPEDVNADGLVAPNDALAIINELNANGSHAMAEVDALRPLYLDVDGDRQVAPIDALAVINQLNAPPIVLAPTLMPQQAHAVPEPSSFALLLVAAFAAAAAWRVNVRQAGVRSVWRSVRSG